MAKLTKEHLMSYYNMTEYQAGEAIRVLPSVKRALKNNAIWATVNHVSKSGMYRKISLYIIRKNRIYCLNYAFGKIFGDKYFNKTREVGISGCGMDMLFEANYRLFKAVFPKTPYQKYCRYNSF